jgi:hypothetical protein
MAKSKQIDSVDSKAKEEISTLLPERSSGILFDAEGKFLHIKVGTADNPASPGDIEEIEGKMVKLITKNNINCAVLVTHHAVEIKIIE